MSWPLSLLIGLLNGVLGAALTTFAADAGTRWHRVSDMEGGRGMLIAFIYLPLGFLAGLAIGIWVARGREVHHFLAGLARLAVAAGIVVGAVAAATGLAWATADHAPTLDGAELDLVFEVRLPPGYPVVADSLEAGDFRVAVVVSNSDRAFANLAFDSVRTDNGALVVPGHSHLRSRGVRTASVAFGTETAAAAQYLDLPLAPSPGRSDLDWSRWMPFQRAGDGSPIPDAERALIRYRVAPTR